MSCKSQEWTLLAWLLAMSVYVSIDSIAYAAQEKASPPHVSDGLYINDQGSPAIRFIESAQKSIDLEIYTMGDAKVLSAIRNAIARRVRVRIIKDGDPVGKACRVFEKASNTNSSDKGTGDCQDQRQLVSDVNASPEGRYIPFNKEQLCGGGSSKCYEHGKMIIIDSQQVLISTGNFDASNLCDLKQRPKSCNMDYTVVSSDTDVVGTLQSIFNHDLAGVHYDLSSVISPSAAKKITVSPLSEKPIISFIKSAKSSILVENQYLKEQAMNDALKQVAGPVNVKITLSSFCAFGKPTPNEVKKVKTTFLAFDKAGISSKLFNRNNTVDGKPGYMHAKAIVVDDSRAWVGSVNGSDWAMKRNREFGLFISNANMVNKLEKQMKADYNSPASESWRQSLACAEDKR